MSQSVVNALLNFIFVSIPEEIFLVAMTLIFIKRFDLLDIRMWKQNLKWLIIPILPVSLMITIFKYIFVIPRPFMTIINLIIFYILMTFILRKNSFEFNKKDYWNLLLGFSLSFVVLGVLEGLTAPVLLYLFNQPLDILNKSFFWNFTLSIPSRTTEYLIVIFIIIKHNSTIKIRLFDMISKNNFLLISIILFSLASNIFGVFILKLIGIDKILDKINLIEQMIVIMSVFLIPTIILFWILFIINSSLTREKRIQQTYESLIEKDDLMSDVEDK